MDEGATKEELRPVKKQLVSNLTTIAHLAYMHVAETTKVVW